MLQTVRNKVILDSINWEWVRKRKMSHVRSFESLELSSFTEIGLLQRRKALSLLIYVVQGHKYIEIEGNNNLHLELVFH